MSPDMWREFFPQFWKPLVEYVHSKGMKFELHSCGYVTPLVGDFVELGMDILQPVQTNNDLKAMKEQWGDQNCLPPAVFDKQSTGWARGEDRSALTSAVTTRSWLPAGNFIPDLVPIDDRYYEIQGEVQQEFEAEFFHKR